MTEAITGRYPKFGRPLLFEQGHAAGYVALDVAVRSVRQATADLFVVAGVDSYLFPETLEWIEACDQLNGGGTTNNAWGFVPGEAAGAIVVASDAYAARIGTSYGSVLGIGLGRETNVIKTDAVCVGEGLTAAFRQALAAAPPHELIHNVVCDLNGETYRADEYGFTALRTKERLRAATEFVAPADCWGDVGSASAPLHIALALIAHRKGYGRGAISLACASSESGERGVAVVRAAVRGA